MAANYKRLEVLGVPTALAVEIAKQIDAGTGNRRRLEELGMVPQVAKEIVANIAAGQANTRRLVALSMLPDIAKDIAQQMGGGGAAALRIVATRGEITPNFSGSARTSANQAMRWRTRVYAGAGGIKAGTARIVVNSFTVPTSAPEVDGAAYDVRAHIEVGGVAYPVTWGGLATGRCPAGASEYVSDGAAGMPDIAAGAEMYLLVYRVYDVGSQPTYLSSAVITPAIPGDALQTAASGVEPGIGTPGAIATGNGWSAAPAILPQPVVVIGQPVDRSKPAIIAAGASIERGLNEGLGDGVNGNGGYVRRGLTPSSGTKWALVNAAHAGESSDTFLANGARRRAYFKYADVLLIGYGGNDYSRGRTSAETLTDCAAIAAAGTAAGVRKVGFLRMAPKSTSTDSFATTANQTIRPNFLAFRSDIDAGVASRGWTLVDIATAYEDSPSIWKAPGYTTDGTHPEPTGHAASAAVLQSAMGSLLAALS